MTTCANLRRIIQSPIIVQQQMASTTSKTLFGLLILYISSFLFYRNLNSVEVLLGSQKVSNSSFTNSAEEPEARKDASSKTKATKISTAVVFYNLFVKEASDADRVLLILQEQLSLLNATFHTAVYLKPIGVPIPALTSNLVTDVDK